MLSFIFSDAVPVGGFCSLDEQCTGSANSGICGHGRCTCAKGFILIDLACEKGNCIYIKVIFKIKNSLYSYSCLTVCVREKLVN